MAASAAEAALRARLAAYDGRAVTLLGEVEAACRTLPGYTDALIALCADRSETVAAGASWLLRSALQSGDALARWLEPLLRHERPFLRAWSLDALAHLAAAHPGHGAAYAAALVRALEDDAASVTARARRLAKRAG